MLLFWIFKNFFGLAVFHQVTGSPASAGVNIEEAGFIGDALRLLEIVSDDAAVVELVLDFVPQRGPSQRLLDLFDFATFVFVDPEPEGNVVKDAGREGIRLLKYHADVTPDSHGIDPVFVDIFSTILYVPFEAESAHQIIHPVQTAQHRAFPTSGGADKRGDGVFLDGNLGVANRLECAVIKLINFAIHDHFILSLRSIRAVARSLGICDGRRLAIHLSQLLLLYLRARETLTD